MMHAVKQARRARGTNDTMNEWPFMEDSAAIVPGMPVIADDPRQQLHPRLDNIPDLSDDEPPPPLTREDSEWEDINFDGEELDDSDEEYVKE